MPLTIRYIVLFDDDRQQPGEFKKLFHDFQPAITIRIVEKYQQLLACIKEQLPDLVIIHINGHNRPVITWLKKLRTINTPEGVPVIIYNGNVPDRNNFAKVFDF